MPILTQHLQIIDFETTGSVCLSHVRYSHGIPFPKKKTDRQISYKLPIKQILSVFHDEPRKIVQACHLKAFTHEISSDILLFTQRNYVLASRT